MPPSSKTTFSAIAAVASAADASLTRHAHGRDR